VDKLLTFPNATNMATSIRAKALLFHDPRSSNLLQQVERIARTDASALIIGETGTGKELIARHIHKQSGRTGPFIAVNCGAFSESLIDAELFGHETGAFTGASQARAGWFEAANGGTMFLDEIGDLSLALQVKLLRVLQERQVVRLGSRRPIDLDVRLVAATNVDLQKAVLSDRFRSDLYYRLSVATINMPPLCERPGDILPLAQHFIDIYSVKMNMTDIGLAAEAQSALLNYEWPGNIRELENVIHFALIVCQGQQIRAEDLKLVATLHRNRISTERSNEQRSAQGQPAAAAIPHVSESTLLEMLYQRLDGLIGELIAAGEPELFDSIEGALIRNVFQFCGQNQVQSAKVLGISRNILRTHLKRFGFIRFDATAANAESSASSLM